MSWEMPGLLGDPYTVDCHAHLSPPRWAEVVPGGRRPDLDALFRQQDAAGVNLTVFGEPGFSRPPDRSPVDAVQEYDDWAAELTARHPDRLLGLASTNPVGGEAFLREVELAGHQLGMRGVTGATTVAGADRGSPRAAAR